MACEPRPSAPYFPGIGSSNDQLSRTSSLPSGLDIVDNPVQFRLTSSRGHKKAQYWRSSVAVTNSDYYNQWRPQLSPLVKLHGSVKPVPSAPSLDTISEYEIELQDRQRPGSRGGPVADPNMFRYTPTPVPSRPTTPQIGSAGFAPVSSPPVGTSNINFLRGSSQAIHITAAAGNQFLPLFLNPETGNVYMFEDGYYIPIPSKSVKELEKATNVNTLTKPPTPDRRSITLPTPPPDCLKFVVAVTILSFLCLNIPVFLIFLLPSLLCSYKVRRYNSLGSVDRARRCYEWTLCSSISGVMFVLLTALALPVTRA